MTDQVRYLHLPGPLDRVGKLSILERAQNEVLPSMESSWNSTIFPRKREEIPPVSSLSLLTATRHGKSTKQGSSSEMVQLSSRTLSDHC